MNTSQKLTPEFEQSVQENRFIKTESQLVKSFASNQEESDPNYISDLTRKYAQEVINNLGISPEIRKAFEEKLHVENFSEIQEILTKFLDFINVHYPELETSVCIYKQDHKRPSYYDGVSGERYEKQPENFKDVIDTKGELVLNGNEYAYCFISIPKNNNNKIIFRFDPKDKKKNEYIAFMKLKNFWNSKGITNHLTSAISYTIGTYTDELTGTMRVEYFNRLCDNQERDNSDKKYCLVFIDLANFKKINDTHGHVVGDKALTEVGKRLNHILRQGDKLIRVGGDEFVIVFEIDERKKNAWLENNQNGDYVKYISDAIQYKIEKESQNINVTNRGGKQVKIGLTVGVYPSNNEEQEIVETEQLVLDDLKDKADKEMLRHKGPEGTINRAFGKILEAIDVIKELKTHKAILGNADAEGIIPRFVKQALGTLEYLKALERSINKKDTK